MSAFKTWREPTEEEFPHGIAALAKFVGDEASLRPSWTRRLVLSEAGEWLLVISAGGTPRIPSICPWEDPIQLQVFQTAYPLREAVEILQGPHNPETVLADRRARTAAHDAEVNAARAKAKADEEARAADAAQLEIDQRKFNYAAWTRLDPVQKFLYALALRIKDRDSALAADLRAVAAEGRGYKPAEPGFPRCDWER
ncbi:MAG: hypothetical protein WCG85_26270 [Polyangia bacterium]